MKKYFFAGLITLLPIMITCLIVIWLFNLLTRPFAGIMETIIFSCESHFSLSLENHTTLVTIFSRMLALIVLFILIFFLGFFGKKFFMGLLLKATDRLFSKIPFIRTIYKMSLDLTKAMFTDNNALFKETVLIPFPSKETHAIAFSTGPIPTLFKDKIPDGMTLFVPTAPHPMSGFVLLSPKKQIVPTDIPTEDAFKFLISCGAMLPGEEKTLKR